MRSECGRRNCFFNFFSPCHCCRIEKISNLPPLNNSHSFLGVCCFTFIDLIRLEHHQQRRFDRLQSTLWGVFSVWPKEMSCWQIVLSISFHLSCEVTHTNMSSFYLLYSWVDPLLLCCLPVGQRRAMELHYAAVLLLPDVKPQSRGRKLKSNPNLSLCLCCCLIHWIEDFVCFWFSETVFLLWVWKKAFVCWLYWKNVHKSHLLCSNLHLFIKHKLVLIVIYEREQQLSTIIASCLLINWLINYL